jgi:hypothetical protein
VLVDEMMPKFSKALVAEANRLSCPCALDEMDDASGGQQIRVFPVEAVSYGTKAIIEEQPCLVPWQVVVIAGGIANEPKHLLAYLILSVFRARLSAASATAILSKRALRAPHGGLPPPRIVEYDNCLAVHINRDLIQQTWRSTHSSTISSPLISGLRYQQVMMKVLAVSDAAALFSSTTKTLELFPKRMSSSVIRR